MINTVDNILNFFSERLDQNNLLYNPKLEISASLAEPDLSTEQRTWSPADLDHD